MVAEPIDGRNGEARVFRREVRAYLLRQQHIGAGQQGRDIRGRIGHALFIRVQPGEDAAFPVRQDRRHRAQRIAAWGFQLDDIGAEIGEELAAVIQRDAGPLLQNTVTGQGHA